MQGEGEVNVIGEYVPGKWETDLTSGSAKAILISTTKNPIPKLFKREISLCEELCIIILNLKIVLGEWTNFDVE